VREAVVLAREDGEGGKRLVAYYTGAEIGAESLRKHLLSRLPEYMAPAAYVRLEALPLTPNGKLDRRALPAPEGADFGRCEYEAPQGAIESALAQIWSELLQVERVGRQDHFFELGGHSLLAVRLMERMRRQGLYADIRTLFTQPTLAGLAQAVRQAQEAGWSEAPAPPNGIEPGCEVITPQMLPLVQLSQGQINQIVQSVPGGAANLQDIYPLAPLQEGLLFHHLLQEQGDPYLRVATLGFDSRERLESFVQALEQVVARHDVLRTAVLWEGLPEPVQVVWRQARIELQTLSLQGADVQGQLERHSDPRLYRLDVRQAPLLRVFAAFDEDGDRWLLRVVWHHLVTDQTTLEGMLQEAALIRAGQEHALGAPVPFRNFVAQARLGVPKQEHEEFFRQTLGDVQEPTAPFGLLEVHGDGADVDEGQQMLERELSQRIRRQARLLGVSAASIFHWAWAQVLGRTAARDDVVFGTVLFGRMQGGAGADRALGLFINTLPIRIHLGQVNVGEGIKQTHQSLAQLMRHEHASLALAQRCSGLPGNAPLFSALLNYRHSVAEPAAAAESAAEGGVQVLSSQGRTNYPCVLSVDDLGTDFALSMKVARPLEAQRLCRYMRQALGQVAQALEQAPQTPAWRIEVLDEAERRQILHEWNATEAEYPKDKLIHELFEEQAEKTPEAVAVVYEEQQVSYGELNRRANQLARHLRRLGVGPETRVAICVERSVEMVIGLLGVLKSGGAYAPLDPQHPQERLAFMLEDAQVKVLLTQKRLSEALPKDHSAQVVCLDGDWELIAQASAGKLENIVTAGNLAYVLYTSGSTGLPKGTMIEHRSVVNYLCWVNQELLNEAGRNIPASTSVTFDASLKQLLAPLLRGDEVWLLSSAVVTEPAELLKEINTRDNVVFNCVPSLWAAILDAIQSQQAVGRTTNLRSLLIGGEQFSAELVKRSFAHAPHLKIWNLYGPTEATANASVARVVPEKEISIGRPIANTQLYVLDGNMNPTPVGASGELYLGGVQLARGYLNRAELTAERFVPDAFSREAGARLYKTGDLSRWLSEGEIEFLGRQDFQVKVRGYRIELGEIEARLQRQPGIREAVALAREDVPGEKRLVAYVVSEQPELDVPGLRQALARSLPEYMLPAAYVRLEALPLTPNGKLDAQALPAPSGADFGRREYEAPQGAIENALAQIWSDLLGVERVGRHDDFFELGGHSLLIVHMIERLRQVGLQTDVRAIYDTPILHTIASRLRPLEPLVSKHLVALRSKGSCRPLFLMHEPSGEVLAYEPLSRYLDDDLPVYGLQAVPIDAAGPVTNEMLAERYVCVIRNVQPHGPYRLAGWSAGGAIAYEMARQLLSENESVEFLGMIDSRPGAADSLAEMPDEEQLMWTMFLDFLRHLHPDLDESKVGGLKSLGSVAAAVEHCHQVGWLTPSFTTEELSWRAARAWQLSMAFATYRPQRLPIPLRLFTADIPEFEDPSHGWEAIAGADLRIELIGGTHLTIMEEPHIRKLAASIERVLVQTEQNVSLD
jgi:amino acid adenylation domain-containing protein